MSHIPFQSIDWTSIEKVKHQGETGEAIWQTVQLGGLRIRVVEYSANYFADHWCKKGHIVHCLEGEFITELSTGEKTTLGKGQSYVVSDDLSSHRSTSANGVKLLIIDGDFLRHIPENMSQESREDRLGKYLVSLMREETLDQYESIKVNAEKNFVNQNKAAKYQETDRERIEFLRSLNDKQMEALDQLIKKTVDSSAFSLLRGLQESMDRCQGTEYVSLNIDGKPAIELDLASGSLFGDYFDWVEKFSKYGEFQH